MYSSLPCGCGSRNRTGISGDITRRADHYTIPRYLKNRQLHSAHKRDLSPRDKSPAQAPAHTTTGTARAHCTAPLPPIHKESTREQLVPCRFYKTHAHAHTQRQDRSCKSKHWTHAQPYSMAVSGNTGAYPALRRGGTIPY
ncbi:MAG: hypothetical protein [Inoviridae sp.]|nr:MAG: hypothetical protein [Inoviridae sp.]